MSENEEVLLYLLSTAIREEKVESSKLKNIDWQGVLEQAKEQNIYSIIYTVIKSLDDNYRPEENIVNEWKKQTILAGITQQRNINQMGLVFENFNKKNIPVIALKGLVLREFYPQKELRTMGDADILIHKEDLEEAEKILLDMGYYEDHRDFKNILFIHENALPIELHWYLIDTYYFKYAQYLETDIWENTSIINIGKAKVIVPSLENQVLHMCLHMAVHLIYSGFGLRQLCDFVLFIEAKNQEIDWMSFLEKAKKCKMNSFSIAIFEVTRRLFGMNIPEELRKSEIRDSPYIDMIIHSILSGGVFKGIFGDKNLGPINDQLVDYYKKHNKNDSRIGKLKYLADFFFPSPRNLSEKYEYARKYPMLLPIAWIQRIIYGGFRRDFNMKEKSVLLLGNSDILEKRVELFKWLDLQ